MSTKIIVHKIIVIESHEKIFYQKDEIFLFQKFIVIQILGIVKQIFISISFVWTNLPFFIVLKKLLLRKLSLNTEETLIFDFNNFTKYYSISFELFYLYSIFV